MKKRLVIALILALMLMMTVGTSVVLAAGPPDVIFIDPDNPEQRVIIIKDDAKDGPPDILVKTPNGARPPNDIPPVKP